MPFAKGGLALRLYDETTGVLVGDRILMADTFWTRAKGLLGRKGLHKGEGLIITPCSSIHSFWMRFPFDAVFLDKNQVVIRAVSGVLPFRILQAKGSRHVVELPAGSIDLYKIQVNHRMRWCD